jgi:hypothetical protein
MPDDKESHIISGGGRWHIPDAWLSGPYTVAEIEAANPGVTDDRSTDMPEIAKPLGFLHARWARMKSTTQPGDTLWTYASPAETWAGLGGTAGVALMHNGVVIGYIETQMN